jgi:hypothetical protein
MVDAWRFRQAGRAASATAFPTAYQHQSPTTPMTVLSFDERGVEVVYEGTEFRLEAELIEEATRKDYPDVTDHEVLQLVEEDPALSAEPRRIQDILD